MSATTNTHPRVTEWVLAGTITEDQGILLCDEARDLEEHYDPYGDEPERVSLWHGARAPRVFMVNEYVLTQRYGGPEEGGWWFYEAIPTEQTVASPFTNEDDAYEVAHDLNTFAERPSWANGYTTRDWRVQAHVPRQPSGRPRYC